MNNAPLRALILLPLSALFVGCASEQEWDENNLAKRPGSELFGVEKGATVELDNGLKVEQIEVGEGDEARDGVRVSVHYTGRLTNGEKFDSSLDRGTPFEILLGAGNVIKGWDIGLQGMKPGGKRKLTIPGDLAYGDRGSPPKIGPDETLVFDVEMISVD